MTNYTWLWFLLVGCVAVAALLWFWKEWFDLDQPHSYDDKLAQWEADVAKAEAEKELKRRPHVRAGKK